MLPGESARTQRRSRGEVWYPEEKMSAWWKEGKVNYKQQQQKIS